jgi:hypothetical protein
MHDDCAAIAALVQDWVVFRDSGDFDRLRQIWTPDGKTNATWFSGSADDFVTCSRETFGAPVPAVLHELFGTSVDVRGDRAVSQTKMAIVLRSAVHGTPCEIKCAGRFYDLWQKLGDAWKLAERCVIYERDRLDPLEGAPYPKLDAAVLASFPPGYRHLAYAQQAGGASVIGGLAGLTGAAVEALYATGRDWLAGAVR